MYLPSLQGDFVTWDDNRNFLENHRYRGLGLDNLRWMWTTTLMGHYIPVTWMTFGMDYVLWGMNPVGYHAVNLVLHGVSVALVFHLARTLLAWPPGAHRDGDVTVAAIFAAAFVGIHPLRVESVAWITERRDMLSLLLYVSTVLLYLRWVSTSRRSAYAWSLVTFSCALLSKGISVTLPAILLILNAYPLRRLDWSRPDARGSAVRVMAEVAPFAILSLAFSVLSVVALDPPEQFGPAEKVVVSTYSLMWYLWKTLLPTRLAPLYEMPQVINPGEWRFVAGYVVTCLVVATLWLKRRSPGFLAAGAAFLVMIFPLLGVVQNGPQLVADRYMYHASTALALLLGGGLVRRGNSLRTVAAFGFVAVMAVLTWRQSHVWRSSESLWSRVLSVDANSSIGHVAMGSLSFDKGDVQGAIVHYRRGLALDADYAEGYNNLGVALAQTGQTQAAIEMYEKSISLRPLYGEALNNWGIALSQLGRFDAAVEKYRQALEIDPDYDDAHANWGNALVRSGKPEEAIAHYQAALSRNPDHAGAEMNWGVALAQQGKLREALMHFDRAVALDPASTEARRYADQARAMLQQR